MSAKRYFTGKPCPKGHISERYVKSRACVECMQISAVAWQVRNREKYLEGQNIQRRLKLFGLTKEAYDALLASQGGGCAICGGAERRKQLSVDHDHSCCPGVKSCGKCVRGLLCSNCNHAIGKFKDDPALLRRAIAYLGG